MERVGIVVPTIGGRPEYLPLCLDSIRKAGNAYILLVGNEGFDAKHLLEDGLIDAYANEVDTSLPGKINYGFSLLPRDIRFINWIGDDDLLTEGSIELATARILQKDNPVLVFGGCRYIDPHGSEIWNQKSGIWAVPLLRFGPQLIPQPGSLYSRSAFERIGGLSTKYGWAFDFKLFLDLTSLGKAAYIPATLAKFRWHPGSLSVSRRRESVAEASKVRVANLPRALKPVSVLWEFLIREATYWAGVKLSRRLESR